MDMQSIIDMVAGFDGALVVRPQPGSDFPGLSWGDACSYYAPDGVMPTRTQPYGTILTKNHPDDGASDLDAPGRFRVDSNAGRQVLQELDADVDPTKADTLLPHPLYASSEWVAVVNPDESTSDRLLVLLRRTRELPRRERTVVTSGATRWRTPSD
jgi:hypothetical protein